MPLTARRVFQFNAITGQLDLIGADPVTVAKTQKLDTNGDIVGPVKIGTPSGTNYSSIGADGILTFVGSSYLKFNTALANPPYAEGSLFYDNTEKSLSYYNDSSDVTINIGQEMVVRVVNKTGAPLYNGDVVYINGAQGNRPTVAKAKADSCTTSETTIGMVTETVINNNAEGYITTFGLVHDLNTSAFTDGDEVYLSAATAGTFTKVKPAWPNEIIRVGYVVVSHINKGIVLFTELNEDNKFGDCIGGNYTGFEDDGTMVFKGNATVYDDLPPFPLLAARTGVNVPDLITFAGNIQQYSFKVNDFVYGATEFFHKYKSGSDLDCHIHWVTNGTEAVDKFVKWEIEYTMSNLASSAPYSNSFPATTIATVEVKIPANTPDRAHIYSNIDGPISGTGKQFGAYIAWRLRRVASTGAAPVAHPFGIAIGFHAEIDTVGSRTEYTK